MFTDKPSVLLQHLQDDLSNQGYFDYQVEACRILRESILKKNTDTVNPDADTLATELFLDMNKRCKDFKLSLVSELDKRLFESMRKTCYEMTTYHRAPFDSFSLSAIMDHGDFGPGASRGTRHTSYLQKIADSALTASSKSLIGLWSSYTRSSVRAFHSERERSAIYGEPRVIQGCSFSCVPKSQKISRGIATEPSLNMFFQKGLAYCLERSFDRHSGLILKNQQTVARELARRGSIDQSFATIDLKSASDTISARLVHALFPAQFCLLADMFRSKYVRVRGDEKKLFMQSTMGNGYTFVLQSIIFFSVVKAVYAELGIPTLAPNRAMYTNRSCPALSAGNFSVFGDDIIVKKEAYDMVIHTLKMIGCIPNEEKSFSQGFFRESCGGDFFQGRFVRGVYNKSLNKTHYIYSTINLLMFWSARNNIRLDRTIAFLFSLVKRRPIPFEYESISAGIVRPFADDPSSGIYEALELKKSVKSLKAFDGTPNALLHAALKGALRHGRLTVRQQNLRYISIMKCNPNFSYISTVTLHDLYLSDAPTVVETVNAYWSNSPVL